MPTPQAPYTQNPALAGSVRAGSVRSANTVLVVDDEASIRRLARVALEQAGLRVLEAGDGATALETARRQRPDVILLDLALPRMSGLEVCRRLRETPPTAKIPVLVITGLLDQARQEAIAQAGAAGVIEKPFTPASLARRVAATLHTAATLAAR